MSTNQFDVVTLSVRAEGLGVEDIVNVFDLQKTDAVPADDGSVLSDLEDWINLVFQIVALVQTVTTIYREFKVANRTQSTLIGTGTITSPAAGVSGGGSLPLGNCGLISYPTSIGKVTGRKYIGGLSVTQIDLDGSLTAAAVTTLINAGNTIRAPYVGATSNWQYGVVQSVSGNLIVPLTTLVTDVGAYQRRRKPGRGS